ncbi:MAG TPA: CocE/NonD family hydrolase [Streptosporangiaceae bacterium]|jgi:hypothetical protein
MTGRIHRLLGVVAGAAVVLAMGAAGPAAARHGAAAGPGAAATWPPDTGRGPCKVTKQADVPDRMRDGTILRTDVYRPRTPAKVPVILMRTQYGKSAAQVQPWRFQSPDWFASHCYIVAVQDVRGQYASGGTFYEFRQDRNDGYDAVEWAAKLAGSTGKVGMYGSSYVGATQWLAAEKAPPHLATIIPSNTSSDYYDGWTYEGGEFRLGFVEPWATADIVLSAAQNRGDTKLAGQLKTAATDIHRWMGYRPYATFPPFHPGSKTVAPYFYDWVRHSTDDAYWKAWAPNQYYNKIKIPVLNFEGWYDAFLAGGTQNFSGMVAKGGSAAARANQRIIIGPWEHVDWGRSGSAPTPMLKAIGPVGESPVNEMMLAWYDHFLKGQDNGVSTGKPTVDYFEMGANVWRRAAGWPLPGTRMTRYYLDSDGHAASVNGTGTLTSAPPASAPADHYTYRPWDPVPSMGGHSCCGTVGGQQGAYDQAPIEQRPDVLVYSGPALTQDLHVTGPISVSLYAKTSARDTDWTAKLVNVHPDGTAVNLNDGIVRAAARDSLSHLSPVTPGKAYKYTISVWPTSNLFKKGDRIRVEISSSDYPQFAPNPNTDAPLGTSKSWQAAHQTILHDAAHPSSITLPVVPAGRLGPAYRHVPTRGIG